MKIRQYWVVRFEYALRVDDEVVDGSEPGRPLTVLTHFAPDLPAGLEAALAGKEPGDYIVGVPPEGAYGPYDPARRLVVQRSELPDEPRLGGAFTAEGPDGQPLLFRVVEVEDYMVVLDANHRWAGKTLEYSFTIHAVRPADQSEVEHGHVHGEGGVTH